jgi:hypothetical protein
VPFTFDHHREEKSNTVLFFSGVIRKPESSDAAKLPLVAGMA